MKRKAKSSEESRLQPRIRVYRGREIVLGPGKAELLAHIAETGSLNRAARRMKMSYMRAWSLVQVMNSAYRRPLVKAERGGSGGGGAELTDDGRRVLALYRKMEKKSLAAMKKPWVALQRVLGEE